jgi:hypothetical protein
MIDQQLTGDHSELDLNPSGFQFSFTDTLIVVFVACIGIFGSIYVFGNMNNDAVGEEKQELSEQLSSIDFKSMPVVLKEDDHATLYSHIQIKGRQAAGQFLQFQVPAYNSQGEYSINFGNGDIRMLDDNEFVYSYMKPGIYNIILEVDYKNQKAVIEEKAIEIKEALDGSPFITSL